MSGRHLEQLRRTATELNGWSDIFDHSSISGGGVFVEVASS